jgi:hypothetical protein
METLESFLKRTQKSEFNEKETELKKLGERILNLLNKKLFPVEEHEKERTSFDNMKAEFLGKLNKYSGPRSEYFKEMLKNINEQERQAGGYPINSD